MHFLKFAVLVSVLTWAGESALSGQAERTKEKTATRGGETQPETVKKQAAKEPKKVVRTDKEWRKILTRLQFKVLRRKGTEPPFRNKYDKHFEPGTYACAACGQALFASETKFNSGCGWPAFYAAKAGDRIRLTPDLSHGVVRTEVTCARCDSHLGHVFPDAPQTPTGNRFCINSAALKFIPAESEKESAKPNQDKTRRSKNADTPTARHRSARE